MSEHMMFVAWSYGLGIFIFAILIGWLIVQRNATLRELKRLEDGGVARRHA